MGETTDKARHKIIIQEYNQGGLKIIDFRNMVIAMKATWVYHILENIDSY